MKQFDVLVTDSRVKHALAAVRNLGKRKLRVATISEDFSPTAFSKYSLESFKMKDFKTDLMNIIKQNKIDVVLPIGYHSNIICSQNQKEIKKFSSLLVADYKNIKQVSDKSSLANFLNKNKISCPKTFVVNKKGDLNKISFSREMIIKSSQEMKGKKVEYAKNKQELTELFEKRKIFGSQIVQEKIIGFGCGYFALCKKGKILASFQHRRIRQYPESGGVSSFSESFYDSKLEKLGKKVIEKLKWSGIIMVECIFDEQDKEYKLIEINPKFWGSLDLAIFSGVEFPYLYFLAAKGIEFPEPKYVPGKKFQWVLPEDTLRIKTSKNKMKAIKEWFFCLFNPKIKKDISYVFQDPLPTLIRIGGTIKQLIK